MGSRVERSGRRVPSRALLVGVVSLVSLWLVWRQVGTAELVNRMRNFELLDGVVMLGFSVMLVGMTGLRWYGVAKSQGEVKLFEAIRTSMVANVLNSVTPSKAGDLAKGWLLGRDKMRGIVAVGLERMVDVTMLGGITLMGYFVDHSQINLLVGGVVIAGVPGLLLLGGVMILMARKRGKQYRWAKMIIQVWNSWRERPKLVLVTMLSSLAVWLTNLSLAIYLAKALGVSRVAEIAVGLPLAIWVGLVPVAMGGIGTRDAALVYFLSDKIEVEILTLVALGYTLVTYWMTALISLPFVTMDAVRLFNRRK